jgi:hypothetical protein
MIQGTADLCYSLVCADFDLPDSTLFALTLDFMCCELLEQRKAAGQERARARACPGNAAFRAS